MANRNCFVDHRGVENQKYYLDSRGLSVSTSINAVSFTYHNEADETVLPQGSGAVTNISMEFPPGTCTLITGRSGSGKSTVLKLLNGLIPELHTGEMTGYTEVDGLNTSKTDIQVLGRKVGTVFQNPRSQFFTATVLEELAFASENFGDVPQLIADHSAKALNRWNITHFALRKLSELSGGELQLVACATATAGPQRILLLDEPTSNLSPTKIDSFTEVIQDLKGSGWTVIIAEHRVYPLKGIADQAVVMENGRIIERMTGDEFFNLSEKRRRDLGLRTLSRPAAALERNDAQSTPDKGIEISNLRYKYGRRLVLNIPRLHLPAGKVVALTGENGAGKSTFARNLIGLAKPERGCTICFNGKPCKSADRQQLSALVMQDVNRQLFAETVQSEVSLGVDSISAQQVDRLLKDLDLDELRDRHPMTLSGGQKQRVVIANALASDAQLYVFDEPTSGVDHRHLMAISSQIRAIAASGKSVLVISHDAEFIGEVADMQLDLKPIRAETDVQLLQ
ncbi:MAG: ABC transporter ATP-binding protein [Corynebacterium sp.]|nr:ABC transporter ATP-binding protein [Corynebacterium sp.]